MDDVYEVRYRLESTAVALIPRFEMWLRGLWRAILDFPTETETKWVLVNKNDLGYDDAPFVQHIRPGPYDHLNPHWKAPECSD